MLTCKEEDTNQKMCSLDYCLEDMITTLVEMTITILQNSNPSIAAAFHSNSCVILLVWMILQWIFCWSSAS